MTDAHNRRQQPGRHRYRRRFRPLYFERCEARLLLSTTPPAAVAPEVPVRFRLEFTDSTGSPISTVESGSQFDVHVYVADQRSLPQGVFAAYLDVLFDESLVVRTGDVAFGESYTNVFASGGNAPGVLDEVGAVASLSAVRQPLDAPPESLLFRAPFRAIDAGSVSFLAEPADQLPDSHALLLGVNGPINETQIAFDSAALEIIAAPGRSSPASRPTAAAEFVSLPGLPPPTEPLAGAGDSPLLPALTLSSSGSENAPTALSLPIPITFSRGLERRDDPWRLFDRSSGERTVPQVAPEPRSAAAPDAPDWILLPIQPQPRADKSVYQLRINASRSDRGMN